MALTNAQMDAKLDEHFGFEAADNVEGVLATLTPDVEHDIVGWPHGPAKSHADVRHFYETLFADLADGEVKSTRRLYGENFMVDDSHWRGRAVGRPFGHEGRGRPRGFRRHHVISRENVWLDLGAIQQQLAPL